MAQGLLSRFLRQPTERSMQLGDTVVLSTNQRARIIGPTELFSQLDAGVFVETGVPVRRVPVGGLRPAAESGAALRAVSR